MKNRCKGGIEILLLLVCVLGAVMFFSLTLAYTAVLSEPRLYTNLKNNLEDQISKKNDAQKNLEILRVRLANIRQKEDSERKVSEGRTETLDKQISNLQNDLRALQANQDSTIAGQLDKETLYALAEQTKRERVQLENDVARLRLRSQLGGEANYQSILHVECSNKMLKLYPTGESFSVDKLSQKSLFQKKIAGFEMVALWVRPDGIDTFEKIFSIMDRLNIPFSYEPLPSNVDIKTTIEGINEAR